MILDVVYNHFGPGDLDLWQFDGWSENDRGGIYFYNDDRAHTPWGDTRPDYGRDEVRQYILDNVFMWLEEYHVDGLRFDGTAYIHSFPGPGDQDLPEGWSLLQWINSQVAEQFPGRITIAEDLQNNKWLTKDVGAGGAGFGSQWDAKFVHPIRQAVITPEDAATLVERHPRRAMLSLQRRRLRTGHLQRIARRGGKRQGARAAGGEPEGC